MDPSVCVCVRAIGMFTPILLNWISNATDVRNCEYHLHFITKFPKLVYNISTRKFTKFSFIKLLTLN